MELRYRLDVGVLRPAHDRQGLRLLRFDAISCPADETTARSEREDVQRVARDQRDDALGRTEEQDLPFPIIEHPQRHAIPLSSAKPCARSSSGPRAGPRSSSWVKPPIPSSEKPTFSSASAPRESTARICCSGSAPIPRPPRDRRSPAPRAPAKWSDPEPPWRARSLRAIG